VAGSGDTSWQDEVARRVRASACTVIFSGAGVSAESGIPTFRGPEGHWRKYRPEDLATPDAFERNPRLVWEWYDHRRTQLAEKLPNAAHHQIADWEKAASGRIHVVTQNVDGLHQRAGSRNVCCLHGDIWTVRCVACGRSQVNREAPLSTLPPLCPCGALQRPGVVWFGEPLPVEEWRRAQDLCNRAELMIVVGTSAVVYPAAGLPLMAKLGGCYLVEINLDRTDLTPRADLFVRGKAARVLQAVQPKF
jgi:NAD-dependent deacetylase